MTQPPSPLTMLLSRHTRRREFITLLGGAAAAWPLAAHAQQGERMRRIGVLMGYAESDLEAQAWVAAFREGLQKLGWAEGRNIRIDLRWAAADGLAQPGGNATGFMMFEYSLSGKWLELLKEVAPGLRRAAVLRESRLPAGIGQFAVIQAVAPSLGVDVRAIGLQDPAEIERAIAAFAQAPDGGLIVTAGPSSVVHRELIIRLAAQHKLPAIYIERFFAAAGGLVSYGPNFVDQTRQAATYVDRILKGEKLADLPVQAPTKYELVINLKTAKALGLDVPPTLLARADEIIE